MKTFAAGARDVEIAGSLPYGINGVPPINRPVRFLGVVSLAAALLSCGGGGSDGPTVPPPPTVDLSAVNAISITGPALTVSVGKRIQLSAQATNANGAVLQGQSFLWSSSPTTTATVEQNGTLFGVAPGTATVTAAIGSKSAQITVTVTAALPAATIAVNAGNGQSATINMAVPVSPSVIVRDAAGDPVAGVAVMFALGPNSGNATGLFQVTDAAGVATVGSSWTLGSTAGPQTMTATSETLTGSPVTFTATAVALAANQRQYNVSTTDGCRSIKLRTGEIKAETAHLTIVADISNPSGGFTAADYAAFGATFESLVWPVLTENFGVPTDIDASGRVVAFFTSAVNALTPAGSTSFVGGFFFSRDLLPRAKDGVVTNFDCPGSNVAEMFYVLAPDPTGSLGLTHSTDFVRNLAIGVIGHEMQHLINASRRLYVSTTAEAFETVWMEEGLSHIAEELLFYEASGRVPRSNLGSSELSGATAAAAAAHIRSNLSRFSLYLKTPSSESPYANNDRIQTRGATWSLLRYLADRGSASTITGQACTITQPIALAVNAFCRIEGGEANQFVIDGSGGSEYTIVAYADSASLQVNGAATNAVAVSGPPSPAQMPASASFSQLAGGTLDMSFHTRLRQRTQGEISARIPHARTRLRQRARGSARFSVSGAQPRTSMASVFVEPVWSRLVNRGPTGMANLEAEFGAQTRGAIRDWAVANYVDDAVGVTAPQLTHPSWNYRSAMSIPSVSPYAIETRNLGTAQNHALAAGGTAYYRLGIGASTTSTVSFTVNGTAPPPNLKLVVVRTK